MTITNNLALIQTLQKANQNKSEVAEVVPQQKYMPKLAPGSYIAVVVNAIYEKNQPSKYGINNRVKLIFEVITNDEPVELRVPCWESVADDSLYVKYLSSLLGRDSRDGFVINELIGSVVEIIVVHNETEKGVYANIENITLLDINQFDTGITI
ncbi:hypothetical protein [Bacillus paramycoides]|uniref:hypothetical protein n=1 Tax=Bacillus paramycoides TaxID=2026194 RepID=UPI002E20B74C|nr:hypothetical protein [Bacillus paramycoides]